MILSYNDVVRKILYIDHVIFNQDHKYEWTLIFNHGQIFSVYYVTSSLYKIQSRVLTPHFGSEGVRTLISKN